ncbi:Effector protein [Paraburkholderia unamae]|uniref:oxidoreductase n=1 Tax=Paraburkholderia unamae TaxID=219649 RepID=UPI001CAECAC0|nr:FAD-dependent oxidoreductase [Paraburkholderia unamae]CAG9248840.1 Effector protein [Paraburkholderia unamae]
MTHNPYAPLLEAGRIGTLELKNRLVMAPMGDNYSTPDGFCTERVQAYFEARARGGAGLLIMGACAVAYPAGASEPFQAGLSRDDFIPGLAALVERVHRHGSKIAAQLQHAGKTATRDLADGRELWVPSVPPPNMPNIFGALTDQEIASFVSGAGKNKPRLRVMDRADIEQMIEFFASAAARAKAAGFDGVEVHGAHTYIVAGFLSPWYNRREDEYGGSLENRARLLIEIIHAIKARTGNDYPVWVRLDGTELNTPGGITLADAVATAKLAAAAGADAISVSAYSTLKRGSDFTEAPLTQHPGAFVEYAKAVRAAVDVPVIAAGRIEADEAGTAIAAGHYDFVALARKMLADPEIPIKLAANRPQDIRPCIYCYACVSEIFVNRPVKCAVNAQTGHEDDAALVPATTPGHVLVVGGGPAGMEAARVASLRGHRVTLVERGERLGGTLFFAALAYPENGRLLDYLVAQMNHLPVEVKLSTAATPELVAQLKPSAIVVATGAKRAAPAIAGATQKHVWSGDELRRLMTNDDAQPIAQAKLSFAERALFKAGGVLRVTNSTEALQGLSKLWMPLGKRVVIVGGGLVGLELAEFLLARGRTVTVLEESGKPGAELSIVRRWRVLEAVEEHAKVERHARVQEITANAVSWVDKDNVEHLVPADSVVLATGAQADDAVARSLAGCGVPLHTAGDCATLGYIEGAMHSGHRVGRLV